MVAQVPKRRLITIGLWIEWASLIWMAVEGTVAWVAAAQARSTALRGFGLDSGLEILASVIVLVRLRQEWHHVSDAPGPQALREGQATAAIGVLLMLLGTYLALTGLEHLQRGQPSHLSLLGIGLAVASAGLMPLLARAKQRVGQQLGSNVLACDCLCSWICAWTAWGLLLGLAMEALLGWPWVDGATTVLIAAAAWYDGVRTIREAQEIMASAPVA